MKPIKNLRIVAVRFTSHGKGYIYKTVSLVNKGDSVVVHTPSNEYKVLKVEDVRKGAEAQEVLRKSSFPLKWIHATLDKDSIEANAKISKM